MTEPTFAYFAYGLSIASDLECPELQPSDGSAPDVRVRFGPVPEQLESPKAQGVLYQVSPDRYLLTIEKIARFLVCNGNEIVIERAPEATDSDLRVFLLGSVIGVLLHQRGVLPLHASAIETRLGAVAFTGPVGFGKSTLAAAFQQRGYRVLTDDVCAISLDPQGKPLVAPGYAQLNLWADALEQLGKSRDELTRTRLFTEKYGLPVRERFTTLPVPLTAVYELKTTNTAQLTLIPVTGKDKVWLIRDNTFRMAIRAGMEQEARYMGLALAVAQHTRTVRVTRPLKPFLLNELADLIENDFGR